MKRKLTRLFVLTLALVMLLGIPVQALSGSIRHGEFTASYCSSFIYEDLTVWFEVELDGTILEPGTYTVTSSTPGVVSFNEDYSEITGTAAGVTQLTVYYNGYALSKKLTVYECPSITYTYENNILTVDFSEFYTGLNLYYKAEGDELWTLASRNARGTYSYWATPGETYTHIMRYWDDKWDCWVVVGEPLVVTIPTAEPVDPEPTEPETPALSFKDVVPGAYYEEAVLWAVEGDITTGTSATTFSPDADCTRAQVVTFLWRAAGEPEPVGGNPFVDVKASDYYYEAVLWAVEEGITNGYGSETIFSPDTPCTRGQVATFLWRLEGEPAPASPVNPFRDVKSGDYFHDAVLWAVEQGITNGYGSNDIFSPNTNCTRGQIVTFLYRAR
ncbi:MAG: S-layer homology domain-containing protein [Oscillospiraceae bacterium]|nr:S-layer homology domain-containing protein [Oscillospiraceae bacterium]